MTLPNMNLKNMLSHAEPWISHDTPDYQFDGASILSLLPKGASEILELPTELLRCSWLKQGGGETEGGSLFSAPSQNK